MSGRNCEKILRYEAIAAGCRGWECYEKMMRPLEQFVAAVNESVGPGKHASLEFDLSPESTQEAVRLLRSVVEICKVLEHRLCPANHRVGHTGDEASTIAGSGPMASRAG